MGHHIQMIIAERKPLEHLAVQYLSAKIVSLQSGAFGVPMTDELFDDISNSSNADTQEEPTKGFTFLTPTMHQLLQNLSRTGPIAYIETDYFGGTGAQAATAWANGILIFGPNVSKEDSINSALAKIGIKKSSNADEFDAVGLGRFRSMDDF